MFKKESERLSTMHSIFVIITEQEFLHAQSSFPDFQTASVKHVVADCLYLRAYSPWSSWSKNFHTS